MYDVFILILVMYDVYILILVMYDVCILILVMYDVYILILVMIKKHFSRQHRYQNFRDENLSKIRKNLTDGLFFRSLTFGNFSQSSDRKLKTTRLMNFHNICILLMIYIALQFFDGVICCTY